MKLLNKIFSIAVAGIAMVGCNDLDTAPMGSTITSDQREEVLGGNPAMAEAGVNTIASNFKQYGKVYSDEHTDVGYPSIMLALDVRGADMVSAYTGYNRYYAQVAYSDITAGSSITNIIWYTMYKQIYACNSLISSLDKESTDKTNMYYLGQAYAVRAFDYHVLAQLYQHTYLGNETKPCVPIITEQNEAEAAANGMPRASVEDVYTQILGDIDTAIELLENSGRLGTTSRNDKKFVTASTAHGLRARVYMCMGRWDEAAADAQYAITNSKATPYSFDELSTPAFNSGSEHSWMWSVNIEPSDRCVTTGICNFPSMMGSLCYGYASVGGWRRVNQNLYRTLSKTDVRSGWWIDESGNGSYAGIASLPVSSSLSKQSWYKGQMQCDEYLYYLSGGSSSYLQVKYAPYENLMYQSNNACDVPLMRVEEMYHIIAEAQAMGGNPSLGAQTLTNFVQTYRDPDYVCTEASAEGVQNEVYRQRRIEFWGEGLGWYDMMRLKRGVDRRGAGFAAAQTYNIPAGDPCLIFQIPQGEQNGNPLLGEINPAATRPNAVK